MTTTKEQAPPLIVPLGHLCCNFCDARYDHAIVEDSKLTPRQQLRQAAERAGWKHTVADLDVCPEDAAGPVGILIESWTLFWSPETALVPAQAGPPDAEGDDEPTTTLPAVVEPVMASAGSHPYPSEETTQ